MYIRKKKVENKEDIIVGAVTGALLLLLSVTQ